MDSLPLFPWPSVGIGGAYFIESAVCTTHGDGEGRGIRANAEGEPKKREYQGRQGRRDRKGGRSILLHSGFVLIECIVTRPRNSGLSEMVWEDKIDL